MIRWFFRTAIVFVLGAVILTAWQVCRENQIVADLSATEATSGELHDALADVAGRYGRPTPHFYISPHDDFFAYSLYGSTFPFRLRRGKIIISRRYASWMSPPSRIGVFAHEMAHLVRDGLVFPMRLGDPVASAEIAQYEMEIDQLAKRHVGSAPLRTTLEEIRQDNLERWRGVESLGSSHGNTAMLRVLLRARDELDSEISKRLAALDAGTAPQKTVGAGR